jgi:putative flippase GtrA
MSAPASRTERVAEFVRFVAVGGSAALLYITLASLLTVCIALPAWLASTIAYACMILPAYLAQRALAFRAETDHGIALPRYLLLQAICAALSAPLTIVVEGLATLQPEFTFAIVAIFLACFSFVLSRQWVFAPQKRTSPDNYPPE